MTKKSGADGVGRHRRSRVTMLSKGCRLVVGKVPSAKIRLDHLKMRISITRIKFDKKISAGETLNLLFEQHKKDILYIKLFDRLYNIRTIKYMKPEKIKKIIDETALFFLPIAAHLNVIKVEDELCELSIEQITRK